MEDIKIKQEVVEKIKSSSNILITVSNDPSVDALSAALGLALVLEKMEKYATAIYSGATPPAISFLEPEKTFETNTDSLRDFIIALNREKADHLRFKPDGDYVKIFITPYKTTIKPEDLEFSQGDFNVELVIALGVEKKDYLDGALSNHGQILHDATVVTVTSGDQTSSLGGIDWHDSKSSSLSEMIVGLAEALKDDKTKSLIDGPVATALLTGIVAQTDRFSNSYTTSGVMTVAANLMTAGADQQLIATRLQQTREVSGEGGAGVSSSESSSAAGPSDAIAIDRSSSEEVSVDLSANSSASNAYALEEPVESSVEPIAQPESQPEPQSEPEPQPSAENAPQSDTPDSAAVETSPSIGPVRSYIAPTTESSVNSAYAPEQPVAPGSVTVNDAPLPSPVGGLVHSAYAVDDEVSAEPAVDPAVESAATSAGSVEPVAPEVAPVPPAVEAAPESAPEPTPEPLVQSAAPTSPDPLAGLPMPPPLPDFSTGIAPPPPPAIPLPESQGPAPEILGDILSQQDGASVAAQPAGPGLLNLPQQGPQPIQPTPAPVPAAVGQFQIPG